MLDIDIDSLIPHRGKIKIINEIIDIQNTSAVSAAVVNSNWPLFDGDAVDSLVLIEGIAQTAAIVEGYKRKQKGKSGVKGWLVGIKNAEFHEEKLPVNTRVIIMLEINILLIITVSWKALRKPERKFWPPSPCRPCVLMMTINNRFSRS